MTSTVILAAATAAEEHVVNELPVPPIWFALTFFVTFVILAIVAASFSGRGIPRGENNPSELSVSEQDVLSEYTSKHRR